tara:strand:- start:44 stop:241 length:198 start_codon:yes stop_codon:yes gene_type:complete
LEIKTEKHRIVEITNRDVISIRKIELLNKIPLTTPINEINMNNKGIFDGVLKFLTFLTINNNGEQ